MVEITQPKAKGKKKYQKGKMFLAHSYDSILNILRNLGRIPKRKGKKWEECQREKEKITT